MIFRAYFFLIFLVTGAMFQFEQLVGSDGDFKLYQNNLRSHERGAGLSKDEWLKVYSGTDKTWSRLREREQKNIGRVVEKRPTQVDTDRNTELHTFFLDGLDNKSYTEQFLEK